MAISTERTSKDEAPTDLLAEVDAQVDAWLTEAGRQPVDASAERLADVLNHPHGLAFTVAFIDGVIRPEDPRVAARNLAASAADVPEFLPWHLRTALHLGAAAGRIAPRLVIPVVRRSLRSMVGHLVIDARPDRLGRSIAKLRTDGRSLNLNLLGETVLGDREAARRLRSTMDLLARDDVDYVSLKVSSVIGPHAPWAFESTVERVVEALTPLYRLAAGAPTTKFVNLDMEEYRDLELTIAVFTRLLDRPDLMYLEAGIVLQAYLPDAVSAMQRLQAWAADRRARGGAAIKVRVVKGANLPMERVDAAVHGWPLATWGSKQDTDTNYKRLLAHAFEPERARNVHIGVAGHNLFDIAYAWILANRRGVTDQVDFEMLLGMAPQQAGAVAHTVGGLRLYTPVVHPRDFDVAIAYLVRRLEEGASDENYMSAAFELSSDSTLHRRELARFRASLAALDHSVPVPNRTQDRTAPVPDVSMTTFANAPDSDPSLLVNQRWAAGIQGRMPTSMVGSGTVAATTIHSSDELDACIAATVSAAPTWGSRTGAERAVILRQVAVELERRRSELCEVMGSEGGKTLDQADPEVSEAIDFANHCADLAEQLDQMDGAAHRPVNVTVVTPPWNFPVAIPAGSTLGPLAAGSTVILKPAHQARRCGAALADALWSAGVPKDVLRLVNVEETELGSQLVSDPRVDRVVLTGAYETAERFRALRPDVHLLAETSGKNAIIVTPSADLDLAVRDVVSSAFGHAGQKCSAASLVVLVGSVAASRRFLGQLTDAVESLVVGLPWSPSSEMGPIIEPAQGKLRRALATLESGESWLVRPRPLDADEVLWTPGVKTGVARGSSFHLTECFGPVLGVMQAATLDDAIALVDEVDYGLTSGLHSLDPDEIEQWLRTVQAGNLYVNRGITGAIVRRQPFGGWKRSAIGPGAKVGGPNSLIPLSDWEPAPSASTIDPSPLVRPLLDAASALDLPDHDLAFLERSFRSDEEAWTTELGVARDSSDLRIERNVFRYLPAQIVIRHEAHAPLAHLLRVVGAAARAGADATASTGTTLPSEVRLALDRLTVPWSEAPRDRWLTSPACHSATRVRLIGDTFGSFSTAVPRPDLAVYAQPVTEAGRLELLPFLKEQAISITAHRFGTPNDLTDHLI